MRPIAIKNMNKYVTLYTKEDGKLELTRDEWYAFHPGRTLHRIDGPAIELANGYLAWYIDNELQFTEGDFNQLIQEVKDMSLVLRLVDPRWWVREFK